VSKTHNPTLNRMLDITSVTYPANIIYISTEISPKCLHLNNYRLLNLIAFWEFYKHKIHTA